MFKTMKIILESIKYTKEQLLNEIVNLTNSFSGDRLYSELRDLIENIQDTQLQNTLLLLVNESDSDKDEPEMVYSVLSSEIDSYFKFIRR